MRKGHLCGEPVARMTGEIRRGPGISCFALIRAMRCPVLAVSSMSKRSPMRSGAHAGPWTWPRWAASSMVKRSPMRRVGLWRGAEHNLRPVEATASMWKGHLCAAAPASTATGWTGASVTDATGVMYGADVTQWCRRHRRPGWQAAIAVIYGDASNRKRQDINRLPIDDQTPACMARPSLIATSCMGANVTQASMSSLSDEVMYGRPPLGKGFFSGSASGSGAVMYPAFVRGALTAGPEGVRGRVPDHLCALDAR
jgi:hypothetical protein